MRKQRVIYLVSTNFLIQLIEGNIFFMIYFSHNFWLLNDHDVQKESDTGMATPCPLPTSWLMVDQLQSPEEQLSW